MNSCFKSHFFLTFPEIPIIPVGVPAALFYGELIESASGAKEVDESKLRVLMIGCPE